MDKKKLRDRLDELADGDDDDAVLELRRLIESSGESPLDILRAIVDKQAEDVGLWFVAQTASEAYLQKALRQLHAAIEGREPEQIISSIIESSGERTVSREGRIRSHAENAHRVGLRLAGEARPGVPEMTPHWIIGQDGEIELRKIYDRHYSARKYRDGRKPRKFVGPGQYIVLTLPDRRALFVWRKFIDDSGQRGVNCAVFRNESSLLSSDLIREADAIADIGWPGERHYTYVRAEAVKSRNPGWCFICAGWTHCGYTKTRLLIFERKELIKDRLGKLVQEFPG